MAYEGDELMSYELFTHGLRELREKSYNALFQNIDTLLLKQNFETSILQFPMLPVLSAQVWHRHDFHYQTRPAGEMLRPLSRTSLGIILLPREACPFPFVEDIVDEVFAERGVDFGCLRFVRAGLRCNILMIVRRRMEIAWRGERGIYM